MTYNITIDDFIGDFGYSKQYIRAELAKCKNKPCNVLVSSPGGDVVHALDICQQFLDHGDVTVYMYGGVASAATVLAMGAKKVCISKYGMFLAHKVSQWVDEWGAMNADQIQELIGKLKDNKLENDKFDLVLANIYADKCKKKVTDILDVLKKGAWMTAQEAKDYGFVDEILGEDDSDVVVDIAHTSKLLNVAGLPAMPKFEPHKEDEMSVLDKLCKKIEGLIHGDKTEKLITMKKDYVKVNAILNVEGVEVDKDGKVTLSEAQVKALNDKFTALESEAAKKDKTIEEQTEQIKNLEQNPGDDTHKVEGDENKDDDAISNTAKTAKEMFNSVKNLI